MIFSSESLASSVNWFGIHFQYKCIISEIYFSIKEIKYLEKPKYKSFYRVIFLSRCLIFCEGNKSNKHCNKIKNSIFFSSFLSYKVNAVHGPDMV